MPKNAFILGCSFDLPFTNSFKNICSILLLYSNYLLLLDENKLVIS